MGHDPGGVHSQVGDAGSHCCGPLFRAYTLLRILVGLRNS